MFFKFYDKIVMVIVMDLRVKSNWITLMQMFVFSAFVGYIYEVIFYYFDMGKIINRGTTFGPWIPIYGFGTVFIILFCHKLRKKPFLVFIITCFISGIVEFFSGYCIFHIFNVRLWDYNVEILNFGNVGGYICLRSVLLFGVSSLLLLYFVLPFFEKLNSKNNKCVNYISIGLFSLFVLDMILSGVFRLIK